MGDITFNVAKGRVAALAALPAAHDALVLVLLKSAGLASDATLKDCATLAAVLAVATEADFDTYARLLVDTDITIAVDNTNDRVDVSFADQTWDEATTGNALGKVVICYDPDTTGGTDTDLIPLTGHDFSVTTDGTDLVLTGGFFRAGE